MRCLADLQVQLKHNKRKSEAIKKLLSADVGVHADNNSVDDSEFGDGQE